jgi:diguanylate cyclase (GGDEF)-like protein
MKYKSAKFLTLLGLPVLLASIGIVWVTLQLLDRVTTVANSADHTRTSQVIRSAFVAEINSLNDLVADNAMWDDAAINVYGTLDDEWFYKTWGILSEQDAYNEVLLIDPKQPSALKAYVKGKKVEVDWVKDIGSGLQSLLAKLPIGANDPATEGAILQTKAGPAVVSVAFVAATTKGLISENIEPRAIVMLRYLNAERLAHISKQYVVKNLQLNSSSTAGALAENAVKDPDGKIVAFVTWDDLKPGEQARESAAGITALALTFLVFVVTAMGLMCWTLVRTIAKREQQAVQSARKDPLTGLPNRLAITETMANFSKHATPYAVAFADLDGFKDVNDTFDHETGDQLLQAIAVGMQHLVPERAKLARLGGDEFIVIFSGDNPLEAATAYARNLISFINMPFDLSGRHARVGVSVGIALSGSTQSSPAELMRQADIAMYHAKTSGKNCQCLYVPSMDDDRDAEIRISQDLRKYLTEDRIQLAYQPIIDARTHQIYAVEALARWPHDAPDNVTPDKFVAVAEQKGLIDMLGEYVLHNACQQLQQWEHVHLNVNVSPLQLNNPAFVETTLAIIRTNGINPNRIEMELTESTLLEDIDRTLNQFALLRAEGIRIALDDFGAGYASLGYLQKLQFDCIKIDKVICNQFASGTKGLNIVQATTLLARGVASSVVAEGIETAEQGEILRLSGCSHLQGFHYHKPKSATEITKLLKTEQRAVA